MAAAAPRAASANGQRFDDDGWQWTQTPKEVLVAVEIAQNVKGRDLHVKMGPHQLEFGYKGQPHLVAGDLYDRVKAEDSTWEINRDDPAHPKVIIHLMKWFENKIARKLTSDPNDLAQTFWWQIILSKPRIEGREPPAKYFLWNGAKGSITM